MVLKKKNASKLDKFRSQFFTEYTVINKYDSHGIYY